MRGLIPALALPLVSIKRKHRVTIADGRANSLPRATQAHPLCALSTWSSPPASFFGVRGLIPALALPQVNIKRKHRVTIADGRANSLPRATQAHPLCALSTWSSPPAFQCAAGRSPDQSSENSEHSKESRVAVEEKSVGDIAYDCHCQ